MRRLPPHRRVTVTPLIFALAISLLAALAAPATPLAAQFIDPSSRIQRPATQPAQARSTGVIDGAVTDTLLRPVAFAEVSVLRTDIKLQTNARGRFRFVDVPAGQYLLIVRRIGFRPVSAIIEVGARDTVRLAYTLEPAVRTLDSVVV